MRTFTFKSLFLTVLFVLLGSTAILAADDGLITKQITLKLDEAGTLPNRIAVSRKNLITNLKIVGKINGTDLKFIREMAGCGYNCDYYNTEKTDGKLSILDLSEAKIVEGGDAYVRYGENHYTSKNDKLGDYVFEGCSGLTSLTIPSSVTSIGEMAFNGCSGLTSLTIPSSITEIGNSAFSDCRGLTNLTIPSSVISIGRGVFSDCSGLTSLTIPSGVTSIGHYAFDSCSGLTNLTIPSGVKSIGVCAFWGCSGLTNLTIPSSVTEICDNAFWGCKGLTSLTIPSSVTKISKGAFCNCSGLTSIYAYLEKIPKLGSDVFTGCDAKNCILYVPTGTYDDYLVSEFGYFENIVDGINKDGLLTTQVTIKLDEAGTLPDRIGENQKNLITNLKIVGKINGTDLKFIREMAGCDFNGDKTDGKLSILDLSEAKIVAGGSAYISYNGFWQYTYNDKLGYYAFYGCSGLTSLTIPSCVTEIGKSAFRGCSGLTSLTIPSSVTEIGESAFSGCSGLTSITIPSSVTSIGSETFRGCSGLTSLTIPSGVTSIGEGVFNGCSGLTSLTIPSGVTSIGDWAFGYCSGLTSLTIPSGVTSIGYCAFYGCRGLTSLTIPSSVTEIGGYAFSWCSGLTSLTIPSSVTSIGYYAFSWCSGLTSIYVYTKKLPKLESDVFSGCNAQNCTVYVPKGTIDDYKSSKFGYFEKIVEFDASGIDKVTTSTNVKEVSRYSANGQRLSAPAKGLNIVKYSDGSVKKVAVQ